MRAVVTRVTEASVTIDGQIVGRIGAGLLVLAAIGREDTADVLRWMAAKIATFRVFASDDNGKAYDRDIMQAAGGAVLAISNFTVLGETVRGRRPGFDRAMPPADAAVAWQSFLDELSAANLTVATGRFGADMLVHSVNDGPSTFVIDSEDRR